jgi:hypothetical protein
VLRKSAATILDEAVTKVSAFSRFDIFLSHSIRDSEIVLGAKDLLERASYTVYVDWVVDPNLDRENVTAATAEKLRTRMRQSDMLVYLYSRHSQVSRWMPWELGYFDGHNGNVAVFPVLPDSGSLDFSKEEYLQLYPKVDFIGISEGAPKAYVNKSKGVETSSGVTSLRTWRDASDKQRPVAA